MTKTGPVVFFLLLMLSCAPSRASVGPLSIEVPEGWHVTSREPANLQLANGTTGDATANRPGTAKAVFDIYLESTVTPSQYKQSLREDNIGAKESASEVDGYDAVVLAYTGSATAGRQEAVFIPDWDVRIVYRAAFGNDDAAFYGGRGAFLEAVRSIRFSGRPDEEPA